MVVMALELRLIGIGTGNPEHVTKQAILALQTADVILVPRKGTAKSDLADLRHQICEAVLQESRPALVEFDLPVRDPNKRYLNAVDEWHDAIALVWQDTLDKAEAVLGHKPKSAALLIWGDPSLYDSSLRIAARLSPQPVISVIPGITSIQALTAAHKIPVNTLGAPFMVTTGRQLRESGFPEGTDTAIIMLDGECSFTYLHQPDFDIWWGAYLGMDVEIIKAGRLDAVADDIIQMRKDARAKQGWIMDCYLLQKRV